ncbi:MAG: ABC transporter permease [Kiloniellales bacterium]|jgi:phospholipid/cholesterol/gamma-HCH transport system permease protein|nr:ABC transporter permease [Kiloniellales bacterium]
MSQRARLERRQDGDCLVLAFAGPWTTMTVAAQDPALAALAPGAARRARLDLSGLEAFDTTGALLVHRTAEQLSARGLEVDLSGGPAAYRNLIETVRSHEVDCPPPPPGRSALAILTERTGRSTYFVLDEALNLVNFLGHTVIVLIGSLLRPRRIRLTALINQMEQTGLNALPIVGLISFLIGVVLAYQGADQLRKFGAEIFTVNLVGVGVLREMAIMLTAIIVAGRSGSAFTAQIGTMKVNEEIDAMRTIGLDPMEVLVLPRVVALVLVLPLLTFYADIMGLLGGAVMANWALDISFYQFARQFNAAVPVWSFWVGLIKAPVFAFIIAVVGCYEGFKVSISAESVGQRTTAAVVEAIFLVIVLDALFSIMFSILGI